MKKKVKILMTLLAALLVGLLLVTACTNPTNGDPGVDGKDGTAGKDGAAGVGEEGKQGEPGEAGGTGPEGKPGVNIETIIIPTPGPGDINVLFQSVDVVVLASSVTSLSTGTYTVPANKTLSVAGSLLLTSTNVTIDATLGTLKLSDTSTITTDPGDFIFLNNKDSAVVLPKISGGGATPPLVSSITSQINNDVAVSSLAIGTGGSTWANLVSNANNYTIYVVGDLAVKGANLDFSDTPLVVLGDIKAEGNVGLANIGSLSLAAGKGLVATADLRVSGIGTFTIPVNTGTHTVTIDPTGLGATLTLANLQSQGSGKLSVDDSFTGIVITAGNGGNIEFTGDPLTLSGTSTFANTGLTTFTKAVEVTTSPATFAGPVNFNDNLTLTAIGATFSGQASFAPTKGAILTTAGSIITLNQGGSLAGGGTDVLANGSATAVTLTPAINTSLSFGQGSILQGSSGTPAAHSITIGGTTPVLNLATGATYTVNSDGTNNATLSVGTDGNFVLGEQGSKLVLTGSANGAILTGPGKVTAAGTEIIGGQYGWKAVGAGTVSIERGKIYAATSVLTGGATGTPDPSITVLAGQTLIIEDDTTINLAAGGCSIVLKNDLGRLNLNGTNAKISGLTGGSGNQTLIAGNITTADFTLTPAANHILGGGAGGAGNGFIAGGGPDSYITEDDAGTTDVTIRSTTTIGS
jgi:hypothetical protein